MADQTVRTGGLQHLTEDELCGVRTPATSDHVACCVQCRMEVDGFRSAATELRIASQVWSERRSATMAVPQPSGSGWRVRHPLTALAAVAALLLATMIPVAMHYEHAQAAQDTVATVAPSAPPSMAAESDVSKDNALLANIDSALSQPVPSPQVLYGVKSGDAPHANASRKEMVN
jgi:hypothetical protein